MFCVSVFNYYITVCGQCGSTTHMRDLQAKIINWCFITGCIVRESPVVKYFIVLKFSFKLLVFYFRISISCHIYAIF